MARRIPPMPIRLHPLLRKRITDLQILQADVGHIADHIVVAVVHTVAGQRIAGPERLIGNFLAALETLLGPCVGFPLAGQVTVAEHTQNIYALLMPHTLPLHAEIEVLPRQRHRCAIGNFGSSGGISVRNLVLVVDLSVPVLVDEFPLTEESVDKTALLVHGIVFRHVLIGIDIAVAGPVLVVDPAAPKSDRSGNRSDDKGRDNRRGPSANAPHRLRAPYCGRSCSYPTR